MTDAELRLLLRDCLTLWSVEGKVTVADDGMAIDTADGQYTLQHAAPDMRPVRWLLQTPARAAAGRPPSVAPSIVAVLSALRNALGWTGGANLRIGAQ